MGRGWLGFCVRYGYSPRLLVMGLVGPCESDPLGLLSRLLTYMAYRCSSWKRESASRSGQHHYIDYNYPDSSSPSVGEIISDSIYHEMGSVFCREEGVTA